MGAQSTVCGGGRYSGLVEELGGKPAEGIGFAAGLERLILILKKEDGFKNKESVPDLFVGAIGNEAQSFAQKLIYNLRNLGIRAEQDLLERSVKAQMKYADKIRAAYSVVIGEDEIAKEKACFKNMTTGEQTECALESAEILKLLNKREDK